VALTFLKKSKQKTFNSAPLFEKRGDQKLLISMPFSANTPHDGLFCFMGRCPKPRPLFEKRGAKTFNFD